MNAVGDTDILKPEAFVGMRKLDSGWEPSDRRDCQ